MPYIRAVGRHHSGNIWVAAATEADHNTLIEVVDDGLSRLSEHLWYSHKFYPVLVHGVPVSFDTSRDGKDVNDELINYNTDIMACPVALWSVEFLGGNNSHLPQTTHSSLILNFTDPTIANMCISCHVALHGSLLPTVKFVHRPPCCFNCHHTGHITCFCQNESKCGLCTGEHNTRRCGGPWVDGTVGQYALLKCTVCSGPHAASGNGCPVCRAAIDMHQVEAMGAGPYYLMFPTFRHPPFTDPPHCAPRSEATAKP